MIINLKQLPNRSSDTTVQEQLDLSELLSGKDGIRALSPLRIHLHAASAGGQAKVAGELATELELSCSRCLTRYIEPLVVPFDETFVLQSMRQDYEERELAADDDETDDHIHVVTEERVDLTPYIEENVIVSLPFIPLCRDDCAGLCPQCGTNRNEKSCDCAQDTLDPRWESLADLFKKQT